MPLKRIAFLLYILFLFPDFAAYSQDSIYARKIIRKLTADEFHGRGYVKQGDRKAADFIADEFRRMGLQMLYNSYFHEFAFGVNTFPGKMSVKVNDQKLVAGKDYIIYPSSASSNKTFNTIIADSADVLKYLKKNEDVCVVISNEHAPPRNELNELLEARTNGAVVILEEKKLTWSVGRSQLKIPVIIILKNNISGKINSIDFNVRSKYIQQHRTKNVYGFVKGSVYPDSFIVFSAHYDHLGRMGRKAIFPGANDNASGVAMMLNMAEHFSKNENKPACSILFMAFAGEEAGLVGSKFYTENPLFPLNRIKMLINLDLLGTGDDGITVVNATEFKEQFNLLKSINEEKKYLPFIGERGKAKNSDHYFFSENGVPSFFIYTMGGIKAYHDVDDIEATLPLTRYNEVFRLLLDFTHKL